MTSYIGYNNILETGTVSATTEQADHPKENAYDWLAYDWWRAAASGTVYLTVDMGANTIVDYWTLAFHDLHKNAGTIKAQYSSDNFAADINDLDTVQTPNDGNAIMRVVTQRNVRYYRFEIVSSGSPSYIGALALGQVLTLPGHIPIPFGSPVLMRDDEILNNVAHTNNFLGSSVLSTGYKFTIEQKLITNAWIDTYWDDFADHARIKPFFYAWDYDNRPTEIMYSKPVKIEYPKRNNPNRNDFSLECMGQRL